MSASLESLKNVTWFRNAKPCGVDVFLQDTVEILKTLES